MKCDEGKPICVNCIKSKRECDYNQRLTFKEPLGAYHHHAAFFGHPVYPPHHPDSLTAARMSAVQQQARSMTSQGNPLTVIAPKPPGIYHFEEVFPRHLHPTVPTDVLPVSMNPAQHGPLNGMSDPPFHIAQMPAPASAHAEMRAVDFFHLPTPLLYSENVGGTGGFAQYAGAAAGLSPWCARILALGTLHNHLRVGVMCRPRMRGLIGLRRTTGARMTRLPWANLTMKWRGYPIRSWGA